MNEVMSVYPWLVLVAMYFVVTLVVAGIRGYIDCRDLGWISGENIWLFFWPRFRLWLVGLFAAIFLTGAFVGINSYCLSDNSVVAKMGIIMVPVLVAGMFVCVSLICCLFMPLCAAVQGLHEID